LFALFEDPCIVRSEEKPVREPKKPDTVLLRKPAHERDSLLNNVTVHDIAPEQPEMVAFGAGCGPRE
jgi:hypothetical protein